MCRSEFKLQKHEQKQNDVIMMCCYVDGPLVCASEEACLYLRKNCLKKKKQRRRKQNYRKIESCDVYICNIICWLFPIECESYSKHDEA